ncbi:MAG: chromate resistance protein [Acidobacteriia bacterium]|nr:chromate resistance protein [Terriglobia bacterium]
MKWITRCNVKVDRVACPWLIRRAKTTLNHPCLGRKGEQ